MNQENWMTFPSTSYFVQKEKKINKARDIRRYSNGGTLYMKSTCKFASYSYWNEETNIKNCSTLLFGKEITGFSRSLFHCSTLSSFTTKSQWKRWDTAQWYDESQNAIEIGEDNQHIFAFNRRRISKICRL